MKAKDSKALVQSKIRHLVELKPVSKDATASVLQLMT